MFAGCRVIQPTAIAVSVTLYRAAMRWRASLSTGWGRVRPSILTLSRGIFLGWRLPETKSIKIEKNSLIVRLADQGRARAEGMGGAMLTQTAYCFEDGGKWTCGVECDGGIMEIGRIKGDTLDVQTNNFWVGNTDECGGAFDLAEGNGTTTYRLQKAAASACLGG